MNPRFLTTWLHQQQVAVAQCIGVGLGLAFLIASQLELSGRTKADTGNRWGLAHRWLIVGVVANRVLPVAILVADHNLVAVACLLLHLCAEFCKEWRPEL